MKFIIKKPAYLLFLYLISCSISSNKQKINILIADREAPLGWVYLKIYSDSSFEFISKGLRDQDVYPGVVKIIKDTLHFIYTDSIPRAGKTAIIKKKTVSYIEGEYPESLNIKLNELQK